jgi:peptidoglycan hydrolase CwlO-like protein
MHKIQLDMESRSSIEATELEKAKDEIFTLNNKLKEKDSTISFLKRENDKLIAINESSFDKKVYVLDPNKNNVDINNELNATRDILAKLSKQVNAEKNKNEKLIKQLDNVNKELDILKSGTKCGLCLEKEGNRLLIIEEDNQDNNEEEEEYTDDAMSLESEVINFPDKVKIPGNEKQQGGKIPKLDFTKVTEKYQTEGAKKTVNKEIKKPLNKNEEIIDKLKNDLKQSQKTIDELNTKIDKYKNLYKGSREKITNKNETIRKLNQRIDSLERQLRKSGISTDDITNKRNDESVFVYNINVE